MLDDLVLVLTVLGTFLLVAIGISLVVTKAYLDWKGRHG